MKIHSNIANTIAAAAALFACQAAHAEITVAFPAEGARIPAVKKCYMIGAVRAGTEEITVNGLKTKPYRTGAFLVMLNTVQGRNNVVEIECPGEKTFVRRFYVEAPPAGPAAPKPPPVEDPDNDARVKKPWRAWKVKSGLFCNRVQPLPGDGESLAYLPAGFEVQGAELEGTDRLCLWLGGRFAFMPRSTVEQCAEGTPLPPRDKPAPDIAAGFAERPSGKKASEIKILVDPGHGGSDTGALSPHGFFEKNANLLQAVEVADALRKAGFDVRMTRTDDSFPSLYARPQEAYDWRADAFISVHHNATPPQTNPSVARYTATFGYDLRGLALAGAVQERIAKAIPEVRNKGVQRKSLAVCRNPAVPSCLIEVDFINCPEGEDAVFGEGAAARRKRVAEAVAVGVKDWAGL